MKRNGGETDVYLEFFFAQAQNAQTAVALALRSRPDYAAGELNRAQHDLRDVSRPMSSACRMHHKHPHSYSLLLVPSPEAAHEAPRACFPGIGQGHPSRFSVLPRWCCFEFCSPALPSHLVFEQKPIPPEMMETIARICVVMNRDFQVRSCKMGAKP